jgi:hypothetical protein
MIPLNRRTLFGLMAAASAPLPAMAAPKCEPPDLTAPGYAARIDYPPAPDRDEAVDFTDHLFPA